MSHANSRSFTYCHKCKNRFASQYMIRGSAKSGLTYSYLCVCGNDFDVTYSEQSRGDWRGAPKVPPALPQKEDTKLATEKKFIEDDFKWKWLSCPECKRVHYKAVLGELQTSYVPCIPCWEKSQSAAELQWH